MCVARKSPSPKASSFSSNFPLTNISPSLVEALLFSLAVFLWMFEIGERLDVFYKLHFNDPCPERVELCLKLTVL